MKPLQVRTRMPKKKEVLGPSYHDFLFLYTGKLTLKAMQCYATIEHPFGGHALYLMGHEKAPGKFILS